MKSKDNSAPGMGEGKASLPRESCQVCRSLRPGIHSARYGSDTLSHQITKAMCVLVITHNREVGPWDTVTDSVTGQVKKPGSTSCVGGCPAESSGFRVKVHSPQQGPKCKKARNEDSV